MISIKKTRLEYVQHKAVRIGDNAEFLRNKTMQLLSDFTSNDTDIIAALKENSNINVCDAKGVTPLHLARFIWRYTQKLIQKGANINSRDLYGDTPLHKAVSGKRFNNVQELLKTPHVDVNIKNNADETPLYLNILSFRNNELYNECNNIAMLLLNNGCDVNLANGAYSETALHRAVEHCDVSIAHALIKKGADVNVRDVTEMTPLHRATLFGCDEMVYMLLYYGADCEDKNLNGRTALELAIRKGRHELAEYLMLYTVDFNGRNAVGNTLLHTAITYNSSLAFKMIENGADVNLTSRGSDCIRLSLCHSSMTSELFDTIWSKINIKIFLENRCKDRPYLYLSIFYMLIENILFSDEVFLKCLYMIFDSPHIKDIVEDHLASDFHCFILYKIHQRCNFSLSLDDRLKILYLFLMNDLEIYYGEVQGLYRQYGFDKSLEALLMHGLSMPLSQRYDELNMVFCKIWYNNFDIYPIVRYKYITQEMQEIYQTYYKANFEYNCENRSYITYVVTKVPSLLQLSRDVVRNTVYNISGKGHYFKVYQVLSQLPVPRVIRDILYLKRPLYKL
ncbi:Ankyrin repeats (3 copies) [Popillia japonica]|uniref:Ankyrin repeats (3 copies) n=1 Tax=Popillia japonica TaxID=7064 RepID=A0AAW1JWK6_POPJA